MNLPKLQFKDADGHAFPKWEIYSLESICDGDSPITYGVLKPGEYFEDGVRLIQIKDLVDGKIKLENLHRISNDLDKEYKRSRIKTHDILISLIGTIGRIAIVSNQLGLANIHRNIGRIRTKYYKFVFHYLNSSFAAKEIEFISSGSSQSALNLSALREIKIPIPAPAEQTKIANFLTAIDEKITQLTQKYDLLKQYKKGVMQQIFSQKLRFKDEDGREFPEWEAKRLGDVATFHNGRAYKQSEWEDNGLPVIRLQNLTGSSTNFYYSNIQLPENQYCNNGDLLYMWSATFGPVWWYGDKAIFHYHIWKIETESMCMSRNYLYYVLDDITAKMKNTSNGSTMAHITKEGILKRAVQLPCVKEQTKIANFLTAINDKITHTKTQLEAVKLYKKGLLQQMFV